jgi:hypothetical protein
MGKFFKGVKRIVRISGEIERKKQELLERYECNFGALFEEISCNLSIIPSELQHYLQAIGVSV